MFRPVPAGEVYGDAELIEEEPPLCVEPERPCRPLNPEVPFHDDEEKKGPHGN